MWSLESRSLCVLPARRELDRKIRTMSTRSKGYCSETEYRVLSLFSGAGAMDAGLERTGRFTTVACIELEKPFCDTLRANRDAGSLVGRSRRSLLYLDLGLAWHRIIGST